uniref:Reverse transcriptase zinc-binding domain-containing protein n=1 Tax=Quercus lobata TaxID=97700 RepID=A0A7N2LB36_QUELO
MLENNHLIDSCLLPFDATRIKAIPVSDLPQSDLMYWALERSGIYSVKSGYRALCDEARSREASSSNSGLVSGLWTNIWKVGVPGKVKHFLWRACTNSLPTKHNLVKRRVLSDLGWDRDFNWVNQFEAAQGSFQDLVAKVLSKPRMREVFATTAWFIWAHRNKSRLNEKTLPLSGIRDAVGNFLQLFRSCRDPPVSNKVMRRRKWTPPNPQVITKSTLMAPCLTKVMKQVWALWVITSGDISV